MAARFVVFTIPALAGHPEQIRIGKVTYVSGVSAPQAYHSSFGEIHAKFLDNLGIVYSTQFYDQDINGAEVPA